MGSASTSNTYPCASTIRKTARKAVPLLSTLLHPAGSRSPVHSTARRISATQWIAASVVPLSPFQSTSLAHSLLLEPLLYKPFLTPLTSTPQTSHWDTPKALWRRSTPKLHQNGLPPMASDLPWLVRSILSPVCGSTKL